MMNFVKSLVSALVILSGFQCQHSDAQGSSDMQGSPIEIGSRLELFIDDYLIEDLTGKAELHLHHPEPKEIVITHDAPWEGSGSGYHSISGWRYLQNVLQSLAD